MDKLERFFCIVQGLVFNPRKRLHIQMGNSAKLERTISRRSLAKKNYVVENENATNANGGARNHPEISFESVHSVRKHHVLFQPGNLALYFYNFLLVLHYLDPLVKKVGDALDLFQGQHPLLVVRVIWLRFLDNLLVIGFDFPAAKCYRFNLINGSRDALMRKGCLTFSKRT